MKNQSLFIALTLISFSSFARDVSYADEYMSPRYDAHYGDIAYEKETENVALSKTVVYMQKNYDDKITQLESELAKTKSRLIEKSINEEKIQAQIKENYENDINVLKKELAARTRSMLEFQRQIEKLKPDADTKNLIKINNELAAELRKSEGQLAVMQLELKKVEPINKNVLPYDKSKARMPASVESN